MLRTRTLFVFAILAAFVSVSANATLSVLSTPQENGTPPAAAQAPAQPAAAPRIEGAPPQQEGAPGSADSVESVQKEINQGNQPLIDAYQQLNQMNPFSQTPPGASGNVAHSPGTPSALSPELQTQLNRVQGILNSPAMKNYLKVMSDPTVQNRLEALVMHKDRMKFIYWELGWIAFVLMLKIWRTNKASGFLSVVFTQLWTLSLLFFGASFLVPRLILGSSYTAFVQSLMSAWK